MIFPSESSNLIGFVLVVDTSYKTGNRMCILAVYKVNLGWKLETRQLHPAVSNSLMTAFIYLLQWDAQNQKINSQKQNNRWKTSTVWFLLWINVWFKCTVTHWISMFDTDWTKNTTLNFFTLYWQMLRFHERKRLHSCFLFNTFLHSLAPSQTKISETFKMLLFNSASTFTHIKTTNIRRLTQEIEFYKYRVNAIIKFT